MTLRTTLLAAALLVLALTPAAAATPAPSVEQFLSSLQPAAPAAPTMLSPIAGAVPAAVGCECPGQYLACCMECSGNRTCSGNSTCQTECSGEEYLCACACRGAC